jgi:hypothetical protein
MEENVKKEISSMVAGIIMKKYGKEYEKEIGGTIDEVLDEVRLKLKEAKGAIEAEGMARLNRRFTAEIEPMLTRLDGKIGALMASDSWSDVSLENLAKEELGWALRERARNWARKAVISEVRFNFDDVFGDD